MGAPSDRHGERTVETRDGRSLVIRPMHRTDADRLVRFHRALSPETTRLRFFTFHPELRPEELDRFTHVDHDRREALVAVDGDEIVAVGRYDRVGDSKAAEVAFVVTDRWQGQGVCTLLFEALAERARAAGVTAFVAETLSENRRMLDVFHGLGLPVRSRFADGVVHVELDITSREVRP